MNTDYIYWTFTAAAQCVSTFVALLLTGYALVLSQIEAARERDDSLQELHAVLRASYHARLTVLAWMTALAVVLSLLVVWVNRTDHVTPGWLMSAAAFFDIVAIVAGLGFVVTIIDPAKYQKAAERQLDQLEQQQHLLQQAQPYREARDSLPAADFLRAFRQLERAMREQLRRLDLIGQGPDEKLAGSVRQMAATLLDNGSIDEALHAELLELGRYRNLIFHGNVDEADASMLDRVTRAIGMIRSIV
ncbi:hypothetical protein AACH06_00420 [Ideonella sp. DXS29W]|uniref:DUF4145 domain-containing protein n=1 Tax=Ideonella lacteola TaxID=2984193 RepID=A0ABU9BK64_9BURK